MSVCAYSLKLGFICTGGVEGKLSLYDQSAKIRIAQTHKHAAEIIGLYFYDKHLQIISISEDKQICLWDANNLECI
jgi:WD40 repeat protein